MKKILIPPNIIYRHSFGWLRRCRRKPESNANANSGSTVKPDDNKATGFSVKIDGKDARFDPASTWATHWEATYQYPENGKTVKEKSALTTIFLANYKLESEGGKVSGNGQKVEKAEQVKIKISFSGAKGTDYSTPIKVGEYNNQPSGPPDATSFNKVYGASIFYFLEGKEKEQSLQSSKTTGKINITGVSDQTISGDIDITDGEHSVKGKFSAKGDRSVK